MIQGNESVLLKGIQCLITCIPDSNSSIGELFGQDLLIEHGKVTAIGKSLPAASRTIDCSSWVVMPGLIDGHTHPIFGGSRAHETVLKARGASYQEIAASGGGIQASCQATRALTTNQMYDNLLRRLQEFLVLGITAVEVKTGYGLNPKEEVRQLEMLYRLCREQKNRPYIIPTFLGPHDACPEAANLDEYLNALIEQLPRIKAITEEHPCPGIANLRLDMFIEKGYFNAEHGRKWFKKGFEYGFDAIIHADEFSESGGGKLAAELAESKPAGAQVHSIDHCQHTNRETLMKLANAGVSMTFLPTTSFFSQIPYTSAEEARNSGINISVASDFNPGSSPVPNLWFASFLALTRSKLTKEEVILGVTKNAAKALGKESDLGILAKGRTANLIAFEGNCSDDFFISPTGPRIKLVSSFF